MLMAKAIVLDFDGVICDSMPRHAAAYREALAPYRPVADEDIYPREGARSESIIRQLLEEVGQSPSDADVKRLSEEKQARFKDHGDVPMYGGAADMVRRLAAAGPLALVTGTRRENLERLIPDLLPLFTVVVAQEDYTHDKPHPEPYATAARSLGVAPADLAALENAPRGVASAKAAGYGRVVAITTTLGAENFDRADFVVNDHATAAAVLAAALEPEPNTD